MNDENFDPEKNPMIKSPSEDDPKTEPDHETGLPFSVKSIVDKKNLPERLKAIYPNETEFEIASDLNVIVQDDGDVQIVKPKKEGFGWDRLSIRDASDEEIEKISDHVLKKER